MKCLGSKRADLFLLNRVGVSLIREDEKVGRMSLGRDIKVDKK